MLAGFVCYADNRFEHSSCRPECPPCRWILSNDCPPWNSQCLPRLNRTHTRSSNTRAFSNRFYVPDLGANKVHEIEMVWEGPRPELAYRRSVDVDRSCVGPRHAVFSESKAGERCSCVTPGYVN
jgi:hypothetical protein